MSDSTELEVISRGESFIAPLAQTPKYGERNSRHHRPFYDNYDVAKAHIAQAVGDISGFQLFGRNVLVAVFCRPNTMEVGPEGNKTTIFMPIKEIMEDWWQNKACHILMKGPEAFKGEPSYMEATFGLGVPAPEVGEWVFANASAGTQIGLCGEGASRPQGLDPRGRQWDLFEWEGWPCRIITDDCFLGRLNKPHELV